MPKDNAGGYLGKDRTPYARTPLLTRSSTPGVVSRHDLGGKMVRRQNGQHLGERSDHDLGDDEIGWLAGADLEPLWCDEQLRELAEGSDIDELEFNSISAPMATKPCAAPASPVLHKVRIH
jgi:hypothetical protein